MNQIIKKDYNGFEIEFEFQNGQLMANATKMCQAFDKKPVEWLRLSSTKVYLEALEARWGNPTGDNQLVTTRVNIDAGTWIHEKLILKLAQWLDVAFEIQCDEWIAELFRTGKVELQPKELSRKDLALMVIQAEEEIEKLLLENQDKQNTINILTHVNKTYTTTEIAKELNLNSAIQLNNLLYDKGIHFKQNNTWVLYSKYSSSGYVEIKQEVLDNGKIIYHRRWTQFGREFLIKLLTPINLID